MGLTVVGRGDVNRDGDWEGTSVGSVGSFVGCLLGLIVCFTVGSFVGGDMDRDGDCEGTLVRSVGSFVGCLLGLIVCFTVGSSVGFRKIPSSRK